MNEDEDTTYLNKFSEIGSVSASAFGAVALPTNRVIPIQMQTLEAMSPQETDGTNHKFSSG